MFVLATCEHRYPSGIAHKNRSILTPATSIRSSPFSSKIYKAYIQPPEINQLGQSRSITYLITSFTYLITSLLELKVTSVAPQYTYHFENTEEQITKYIYSKIISISKNHSRQPPRGKLPPFKNPDRTPPATDSTTSASPYDPSPHSEISPPSWPTL